MISLHLFKRKEFVIPTLRGWVAIFLLLIVILFLLITNIYPFLAMNQPAGGDVLVVEGWLPVSALEQAIDLFKKGNYSKILTTGGPFPYQSPLLPYPTIAELSAATLIRLGVDKKLVTAVPAPPTKKDRTYTSVLALKKWITDSLSSLQSMDIFSLGPHARRSYILFNKVFQNKIRIGVIAGEELQYDPKRWWMSSEGGRDVIGEAIGYVYAKIFF